MWASDVCKYNSFHGEIFYLIATYQTIYYMHVVD